MKPAVMMWFTAYCIILAVIYFVLAVVGVFFLVLSQESTEEQLLFFGIFYLVLGLVFLVPYAVAPFLRPRPWVWVFDLVLICGGMTSCCFLPACIPLLIYWIKPETKAYFGRT